MPLNNKFNTKRDNKPQAQFRGWIGGKMDEMLVMEGIRTED